MPNPWMTLRRDQLLLVNKVEIRKNNLKKGWRRRRKKRLNKDQLDVTQSSTYCTLLKLPWRRRGSVVSIRMGKIPPGCEVICMTDIGIGRLFVNKFAMMVCTK
jgi:hypothetical protein